MFIKAVNATPLTSPSHILYALATTNNHPCGTDGTHNWCSLFDVSPAIENNIGCHVRPGLYPTRRCHCESR